MDKNSAQEALDNADRVLAREDLPEGGLAEAAFVAGAEVKVVDMLPTELAVATYATDEAIKLLVEQANSLVKYANELVITGSDDVKNATADLSIVANLKKALEAKRQEYVGPLNEEVKSINAFFKDITDPVKEADQIARRKILDYNAEVERKRWEAERIEEEKLRLAREEEALTGEHTVDLTPIEKPAETPNSVRTDAGDAHKVMVKKWEVEDISKVPEEYLKVDEVAIGKLVRAGIKSIAGIRIWEEPTLRINARSG